MDGDGRREIALLGSGPDWINLFSEILRAHGFHCRKVSDLDQIHAWLNGNGKGCPLLIAEAEPEGPIAGLVQGIHAAFPGVRVLSLPSDFKPSELFFLISTALSAWADYQDQCLLASAFEAA